MMKTSSVDKTFCTTSEASALLGVSVGTIQLWVENGLLEAWKTAGGHRRVVRSSIDRLIRSAPQPAPAAPPAVAVPQPAPATPERPLVLVVEDDRHLLRLYEAQFARWALDADFQCVDNAMAALVAIGKRQPRVLVTDLQMPHMNGFEMIRVLNQHPDTGNMKIIAVSGMGKDAIRAEGGLPYSVEVFEKPVPFDRLKASIAQALAVAASPRRAKPART